MAKLGKRLQAANENVEAEKLYTLDEALAIVKKNATAKFDETVEIAMNLGVDPRHSDQMVRGMISLPHGIGKDVRVAVFAKGEKATQAKEAGADVIGDDDLVEKVRKGEVDFDRCIATPDMMAKVGALGKVLGPKGLMPNPKLGTVTMEVAAAVKAAKSGQIEYRTEKGGIVHAGVGKASFDEKKLRENIRAFVEAIVNARPSGAKGIYVKKVAISSTMAPGVKLDVAELLGKKAA